MSDHDNIQTALNAGMALGVPHKLADVSSVVVPAGAMHQVVQPPLPHPDRDEAPARARSTYRPATVGALIDVVSRHHDTDSTTIWVHPTNGHMVAVFNDAAPDAPAWRDHRAELSLTVTPEWNHWLSNDGRLLGQMSFAEHVEDGLTEIATPPAADLLEMAQTFQAKQDVNFRSAVRLGDGSIQAQYDEEIDAKAGRKGQMKIPSEFTLVVAPFLGEDPRELTARLRYRIREGKLVIGYKLDHPERVVRETLLAIGETLAESFSSVFIGEPGS